MEILIILSTGLSIGFLSSFFGIGGGSLIVPVLYALYPQMDNSQVISTSLLTIFFLTINNSYQYYKIKLLPSAKTTMNIFISASIGAVIGAHLTLLIDTALSKKILGLLLVALSLKMSLEKPQKQTDSSTELTESHPLKMSLVCFLGAFISSLTGLGGGAIFIPLFISIVKLPYKFLSPFSNIAMVVSTLVGCVPYLMQKKIPLDNLHYLIESSFIGRVNIAIAIVLFICSYMTSKAGVRLNDRISNKAKRLSLATLLIILGLKILLI